MRCVRFRAPLVLGLALALSWTPVHPARAESFPCRPIRLVVPFPPGGGTDLIARTLADQMAKDLEVPVVLENKPGAGTIIGTEFVARSAPDGCTLLMATFAHAVNESLHAKLPYSTERSFTPVALIGRSPNILAISPRRSFAGVRELVAYARAHPGELSYGSFGNGTSAHLAGELFKSLAGVEITHVPYKGSAPALTDLLAGQIDLMFTTVASVSPQIRSGRLKALAVTSPVRSPAFAELPTVAEAGVPGYAVGSWYGVYAPEGTPAPVIARLNLAVRRAVQTGSFASRIEEEGLIVDAGRPEDLARYVEGERTRWRKLIEAVHLQPD
jgi:tripartite-type tricarboxylate transporter receptor subunit TctC